MRITPTQTSFAPSGSPPSFRIKTDGGRYYAVQVATDAFLLNGAAAGRRTQANYFDSWHGDDRGYAPGHRQFRREVAGQHLEARTGQSTYTLPQPVWNRLKQANQLYYRLIVFADERRRRPVASVADVDWSRAPSISIARLPVQPARSPVAAFRGRNVLNRADFLDQAISQIGSRGIVQGRDGDFRYALLDAKRFHMTVVECHEWGLADTVDKMPRKPDAVINGQFVSGAVGTDTEGQVIREGSLIHANSQSARYYIAQTWRGSNVSDYHVGRGNPNTAELDARAAFGGLGPVLLGSTPIFPLTPWAQSIYNRSSNTGRGVIAIDRNRGLILLLVQEDRTWFSSNTMTMGNLRTWLQTHGFTDALFNDGSDSEALFVQGSWLLTPGTVKDEVMDFAIGFVDRQRNRRIRMLAIDGTASRDGETFVNGIARPLITHYATRNISLDLRSLPTLSSIANTFRSGIIEAGQATTQAQANLIGQIIQQAGREGHWADILYVSSHAWRHGQLWYHRGGGDSGPILMLANLWSSSFRPVWRTTPNWLILAGCAVLALRYSRGVRLDATERSHLVDWHRDIHGAGVTVPGLTDSKQTLFAVYHPGWAWYNRVFRRNPSLRGVLGYWYRSPGGGRDVEIIEAFTEKLREGESFLRAWESANQRGIFEASAAWAAMVRVGCESDTLATLEAANLTPSTGSFKYYDRFQHGRTLPDAYHYANRLDDSERVGGVSIRHNSEYDALALEELEALAVAPTSSNFLEYTDGVGPQ